MKSQEMIIIRVGTAVETNDGDDHRDCVSSLDVDIGGDKKQMFVRSAASRHEHDVHTHMMIEFLYSQ